MSLSSWWAGTAIAITNLPPRKMMGIDSCGMLISAVYHEQGAERLHLLLVDDRIPRRRQAVLSRHASVKTERKGPALRYEVPPKS